MHVPIVLLFALSASALAGEPGSLQLLLERSAAKLARVQPVVRALVAYAHDGQNISSVERVKRAATERLRKLSKRTMQGEQIAKRWVWSPTVIQDDTPNAPPIGENVDLLDGSTVVLATPTSVPVAPTFTSTTSTDPPASTDAPMSMVTTSFDPVMDDGTGTDSSPDDGPASDLTVDDPATTDSSIDDSPADDASAVDGSLDDSAVDISDDASIQNADSPSDDDPATDTSLVDASATDSTYPTVPSPSTMVKRRVNDERYVWGASIINDGATGVPAPGVNANLLSSETTIILATPTLAAPAAPSFPPRVTLSSVASTPAVSLAAVTSSTLTDEYSTRPQSASLAVQSPSLSPSVAPASVVTPTPLHQHHKHHLEPNSFKKHKRAAV